MSECMPKVWWSPSELGWFRRDATGRAFVVYGDEVWDELPADAVELKPVSDAPATPGETEWGVAMVAENDADWIDYTICQGETSARILADREPENRLMKRTVTRSEWQEVPDDV